MVLLFFRLLELFLLSLKAEALGSVDFGVFVFLFVGLGKIISDGCGEGLDSGESFSGVVELFGFFDFLVEFLLFFFHASHSLGT